MKKWLFIRGFSHFPVDKTLFYKSKASSLRFIAGAAALSVRQNVARWVEKDARAADRVIKREVKSVRNELGALAAEAQQMRKSGKQLESERSSGRPESRSKGVDR